MSQKPQNENSSTGIPILFWILIIFLFVVIVYYAIKGAKERLTDLRTRLKAKKEEFEALLKKVEEAEKLKRRCLTAKKILRVSLRVVIVLGLGGLNYLYVKHCYPNGSSLKETLECISVLSSSLFFAISLFLFLRYGNFFEMRTTYRAVQITIIALCFRKRHETIDAILRIRIFTAETLRKEITDTEREIKELEELNAKAQEFQTVPGV